MARKPKAGHRVKVTASQRGATELDRIIGTRLRARRLEVGISQEALARQVGLTFQQIQKYEKGTNRLGSVRLVQFAEILQVDTSYFLADLKANGKGTTIVSRFAEFLATKDGTEIVEAMMKLGRPELRRSVIELARKLGAAYGGYA
jgi:transcriptional regulator with XRE-family HTH domain